MATGLGYGPLDVSSQWGEHLFLHVQWERDASSLLFQLSLCLIWGVHLSFERTREILSAFPFYPSNPIHKVRVLMAQLFLKILLLYYYNGS